MNKPIKHSVWSLFGLMACLGLVGDAARAEVQGTIRLDPNLRKGTAISGQILLYSPNPLIGGSSVSHWDTSAFPNLLMEPNINTDLPFGGLDVSPGQMSDIGWPMGQSQFNIIDLDDPGTGFTDPAVFPGAPGNPATTLGEARMNLVAAVLDIWGQTLQSSVPIDVLVTWQALPCTAGAGAILGSARTLTVLRDSPLLPFEGTWFNAAEAESLIGQNSNGDPMNGGGDIIVFLNSQIDEECLGQGTGFYYGTDGNEPSGFQNLGNVLVHELGHGLGMSTVTSTASGVQLQGFPSIYDRFLLDLNSGKTWNQMTDAERQASAVNDKNLVWDGANANAAAAGLLEPGISVLETDLLPEPNRFIVGAAQFGPALTEGGVTAPLACGANGTQTAAAAFPLLRFNTDACEALTNAADIAGKIAIVDRGGCVFTTKALNAQNAGAVGLVIVSYADSVVGPGGGDPDVTIPTVMMKRSEGRRLQEAVCPAENVPQLVFANWLSGIFGVTTNTTRLVLTNGRDRTESGEVQFRDGAGNPSMVSIDGQEMDTFAFEIPSRGSLEIETDPIGVLKSGIIEVHSNLSDSGLEGTAVLKAVGSFVSVADSKLGPKHRLYVSVTSEENTGIALYNPDPENSALLFLLLVDEDGLQVDALQITLGPLQQFLSFVDEPGLFSNFFSGFNGDFKGALHIVTFAARDVASLALLQRSNGALIAVSSSDNTAIEP